MILPDVDSSCAEIMENISKEFFEELLKEIHRDVILLAAENLRYTEGITSAVKKGWPTVEGEKWLTDLNDLVISISGNLENYYQQIETDFNKIFSEWEIFRASHEGE